MAKFYIKNDKFRWEYSDIRIEFSEPIIQAYEDYVEISKMEEVLYFYYRVKFYKKEYYTWNEERDEEVKRWKLVSERSVYDFPCIEQLKYILEEITKPIDKNDCQKVKYRDGSIAYRYMMETEGFICEDIYRITKLFSNKKDPTYSLYAGCTFDIQGDHESTGINSNYLKEEDLSILLECVNAFLDFSIFCYNKNMIRSMEAEINSLKIVDGKLYKMQIDDAWNATENIDTIFGIGEKIDVKVKGFEDKFNNVEIKEIGEDEFTFTHYTKRYTAKISDILHIFNEPTDEMLSFNQDEIKDDFKSIMSKTMIDDFKNLDAYLLYDKYGEAIISRTWMCRNEHHLPNLVWSEDNHENVYANVKTIIARIKDELLTN